MDALNDLDALCGKTTLLAKAEDINARTGPNRGKEKIEGGRRTRHGRLIGCDSEFTEVGVHAGAAGKVDEYFHFYSFCGFALSAAAAAFIALELKLDFCLVFELLIFDGVGIARLVAAPQGSWEDISELVLAER